MERRADPAEHHDSQDRGEGEQADPEEGGRPLQQIEDLHALLTTTPLRTLPLWLLGSDDVKERIAEASEGFPVGLVRRQARLDEGVAGVGEVGGELLGDLLCRRVGHPQCGRDAGEIQLAIRRTDVSHGTDRPSPRRGRPDGSPLVAARQHPAAALISW
jgi:hypothetical protein